MPADKPAAVGRTCLYPACLGQPLVLGPFRVRDLALLSLPALLSLILLVRTGAQWPLCLCLLALFLRIRAQGGKTLGTTFYRALRHLLRDRRDRAAPAEERSGPPVFVLPPLGLCTGAEADARISEFSAVLGASLREGGTVWIGTERHRPDVSGTRETLQAIRDDPDASEPRKALASGFLTQLETLCGPAPRAAVRVSAPRGGGKKRVRKPDRPAARPKRHGTGAGPAAPGTGPKRTVRTPYTLGWGTPEEADVRPGTRNAGGTNEGGRRT